MAVRFNGSSQKYNRTTNLPSYTAVTMCGWITLRATPGTYAAALALGNNGAAQGIFFGNFGGTWGVNDGGVVAVGSAPASGDTLFVAITRDGSNTVGYSRAPSATTLSTGSKANSASLGTPNDMVIATSAYDGTDWLQVDVWNVKVWDRVLTSAELLIESFYARPMFPSSLNTWLPMADSSSGVTDFSGNGRNMTATASPTTIDGSHGLWVPSRKIFLPAAAASGAIAGTADMVFGAGSSTLTGAGALAGSSANVFGAGSSTLTGAGVLAGSAAMVFDAGSSTLVGSGALAGTAALTFGAGSSTLTGAGALTGSAAMVFGEGSSTLTGAGALAGAAAMVFGGTLQLSGDIAGVSAMTFGEGSSTLTGAGALAGTAALTFGAGSSVLTGAGALAGSSAITFTPTGDLTGTAEGAIAGTAGMSFGGAGALTGAGALAGVVSLEFGASAAIRDASAQTLSGGYVDLGTITERRRRKRREEEEARARAEEGMGSAPLPAQAPDVPDQQRIRRKITRSDIAGRVSLPGTDTDTDVARIAAKQRRRRQDEELLLM